MFALVRAGFRATMLYPSRLFVDVIRPILAILVRIALIFSITALSGTDTLLGMSLPDLFLYYAAVEFLANIPTFYIPWKIRDDIDTGKIGLTLLRPMDPSAWYFFFSVGTTLPTLLFILLLILGLTFVSGRVVNILVFALVAVAYLIFTSLYDAVTGLIAAWTYRIGYIRAVLGWLFWGILGGQFVPLDVLPSWLQAVTLYLPFRYLSYGAAKALLGSANVYSVLIGFLWCIPMYLTYRLLYFRAVRRAEVFGG